MTVVRSIATSVGLVHATAQIDPRAELADDVEVGPYCVVGAGVRVGEGTRLLAHVVVSGQTSIGPGNVFHPFTVIGGEPQIRKDFAPAAARSGGLEIGTGNVFREHVTVSVAAGAAPTRIGDHNLLMAGAHVAHDVVLGSHCVIANGVQLAGHVVVEDWVNFGGLSGVAQKVRVGESAFVAAGAMCERDVPRFVIVQGDRARVRALNVVGLRRRGIPAESIVALERAYARSFGRRGGEGFAAAVGALDRTDAYVDAFVRSLH